MTSCLIGLDNGDGTVSYIQCLADGYLTFVGNILQNFYSDLDKVKLLIEGGNISFLGKYPKGYNGEKPNISFSNPFSVEPNEYSEPIDTPSEYEVMYRQNDYVDFFLHPYISHRYLFIDGRWLYVYTEWNIPKGMENFSWMDIDFVFPSGTLCDVWDTRQINNPIESYFVDLKNEVEMALERLKRMVEREEEKMLIEMRSKK